MDATKASFKLTAGEKSAIAARHQSGESSTALGRSFGVHVTAVIAFLKRRGVYRPMTGLPGRRAQRKLTFAQRDEMVREYAEGATTTSLGRKYGINPSGVWMHVKKAGVSRSRAEADDLRRFACDHGAFDAVTEASAYWAGFLMADGCVTLHKHSGRHYVTLALSVKDRHHVEAFRAFLGAEHAIRTQASNGFGRRGGAAHEVASLSVCSDRLAAALATFGVVPRKTHGCRVLRLENDRHFWRGMVDGDGFVTRTARGVPFLGLVGCRPLLDQFADYARSVAPAARAAVRPMGSIFTCRLSAGPAVVLARHLYDGCAVALPRKLESARALVRADEERRAAREARRWCTFPGCGRPMNGHGLCRMHRKREKKHGSPGLVATRWAGPRPALTPR